MMTETSKFPALEEAIIMAGGLRKLAALIERPVTTIQYWRSKGYIPRAEDALAIWKALGGKVSKSSLAPQAFKRSA